jgi:hypothetical protein
MPLYLVERILPGASIDAVQAIRRASEEACRAFAAEGKAVRYLRSTFTPGDSRCRCLFEAANADLVEEVNQAAQIPYSCIIIAVDVEPPSGSSAEHTTPCRHPTPTVRDTKGAMPCDDS